MQGLRGGLPGVERFESRRNPGVAPPNVPDTARPGVQLLAAHQVQRNRAGRAVAVDADQVPVHALRGPGMFEGLSSARSDRAILQWDRGLRAGELYRLPVLCDRLPV